MTWVVLLSDKMKERVKMSAAKRDRYTRVQVAGHLRDLLDEKLGEEGV